MSAGNGNRNSGSANMGYTKDRCFKCGSYDLKVVADGKQHPHLACKDCGAHVRDFDYA